MSTFARDLAWENRSEDTKEAYDKERWRNNGELIVQGTLVTPACIRLTRDAKVGEEVTVSYGFETCMEHIEPPELDSECMAMQNFTSEVMELVLRHVDVGAMDKIITGKGYKKMASPQGGTG